MGLDVEVEIGKEGMAFTCTFVGTSVLLLW